MYYKISSEKLTGVTKILNQIRPDITETIVELEVCADWNEGAEHQNWIDTASAQEIADWLVSFLNGGTGTPRKSVWVCSSCGRAVFDNPNSTRGWLIGNHKDAEKHFHGEMVIRCPDHITGYALRCAQNGQDDVRS